jgi:UDP-N-acetyl-D-mannosaminuronic acid transferase (WecB/TagA/CpsF family)
MRLVGMVGIFRLAVEPKRLFSRYVLGIPIYFSHVAEVRMSGKRPGGQGTH